MLELGAGADILRSLGNAYVGVLIVSLILSVWLPKRRWQKIALVLIVLGVFTGPALFRGREQDKLIAERKAKYEEAKALFDERCKTAGEKIYRTVEGVEGIRLTNWKPRTAHVDWADPSWRFAAFPTESSAEDYIKSFLYWEHLQRSQAPDDPRRASRSYVNSTPSEYPGYRYVEVVDEKDQLQRYELEQAGSSTLKRFSVNDGVARYAVSFSRILTSIQSEQWISGAKVTVTDLQTRNVLAEGAWYAFEPGLGSTVGGRSPWASANVCPESGYGASPTRFFVTKVLKPKQGE